jgi:hypothetical protein
MLSELQNWIEMLLSMAYRAKAAAARVRHPTRLSKNADYEAKMARSGRTASRGRMVAQNRRSMSGIRREAARTARELLPDLRIHSVRWATKGAKPRMLSTRVKL